MDAKGHDSHHAPAGGWYPAVDVPSRGDDLVIRAELPGIDPDKDVEITVHDGLLTIRGEYGVLEIVVPAAAQANGARRIPVSVGSALPAAEAPAEAPAETPTDPPTEAAS